MSKYRQDAPECRQYAPTKIDWTILQILKKACKIKLYSFSLISPTAGIKVVKEKNEITYAYTKIKSSSINKLRFVFLRSRNGSSYRYGDVLMQLGQFRLGKMKKLKFMHEEKTSKNKTIERAESQLCELKIDETLDESFPASDPPSWTLGTDHRSESSEQKSRSRIKELKQTRNGKRHEK